MGSGSSISVRTVTSGRRIERKRAYVVPWVVRFFAVERDAYHPERSRVGTVHQPLSLTSKASPLYLLSPSHPALSSPAASRSGCSSPLLNLRTTANFQQKRTVRAFLYFSVELSEPENHGNFQYGKVECAFLCFSVVLSVLFGAFCTVRWCFLYLSMEILYFSVERH